MIYRHIVKANVKICKIRKPTCSTYNAYEDLKASIARRLAAAIMRASPTKNTPISSAMESLLQLDDGATDGEFLAVVKEYDTKPLDDEGTVPDDFDFLQPGKALGAFVQSAVGRIRAPKGLDDVADELANMSARERNILVENVVSGKEGWKYDMASLPVGCELN